MPATDNSVQILLVATGADHRETRVSNPAALGDILAEIINFGERAPRLPPSARPKARASACVSPTFGVLELPSTRFKVFRALDGRRFCTSPDKPNITAYLIILGFRGSSRCSRWWQCACSFRPSAVAQLRTETFQRNTCATAA
jgi:hypothetical protein